jgi:DNA-binding LacI/PurR family transcriptional regulator
LYDSKESESPGNTPMNDNRQKNTISTKRSDWRLTIGFVSGHIRGGLTRTVWQGVVDAAREREANVICFPARPLDTPFGFESQGNVLYDLVNPDMLDGLVVWVTRLTEYAGPENAKRVLEQYRAIPIIAIERGGPEDIPYVDADNYQAVREAIIHLIQVHGYRRIAFIRGPDATHAGARAVSGLSRRFARVWPAD